MKVIRQLLCCLLVLTVFFAAALPAEAADGNVTYRGHSEGYIFQPGSSYSPTDLFPNFKDVMPGDSITQRIHVRNKTANRVKIRLYMRALGAHEDSEEFLSQMNLRVVKETDTLLFDAPADQTAQLTKWTYLGTLYYGGDTELNVTLDVPVEMDNRFQNAVGYLDWEFMVEEYPVESTDPQPPKTGDTILQYAICMILSGSALLMILILFRRKMKPATT